MDKLLGHCNEDRKESTMPKDKNHLRSRSMAKLGETNKVSYMDHKSDQGTASVT